MNSVCGISSYCEGVDEQLCWAVWLRVRLDRGAVQAGWPAGPHGRHSPTGDVMICKPGVLQDLMAAILRQVTSWFASRATCRTSWPPFSDRWRHDLQDGRPAWPAGRHSQTGDVMICKPEDLIAAILRQVAGLRRQCFQAMFRIRNCTDPSHRSGSWR